MTIKEKYFILIPAIILFGFVAFLSPSSFLGKKPAMDQAEGADGIAYATPAIITLNQPSNVKVTIPITDSRFIAGSANLQRLNASGTVIATLGILNDTGTNGDAVAGDKILTIQRSFNEATTTPVQLRVSWALKGVLKRAMSNIIKIKIDGYETFVNGTFSFQYPTFGQPTQITTTTDQGGTFINIEVFSTITKDFVKQFGVALYKNENHLSLMEWFQQNVDSSGILISSGSFAQQKLVNGIATIANVGPMPDEYLDGPVDDIFAISPDGGTIAALYISQVNELDLYGYNLDAQKSLLQNIIQSIQF